MYTDIQMCLESSGHDFHKPYRKLRMGVVIGIKEIERELNPEVLL